MSGVVLKFSFSTKCHSLIELVESLIIKTFGKQDCNILTCVCSENSLIAIFEDANFANKLLETKLELPDGDTVQVENCIGQNSSFVEICWRPASDFMEEIIVCLRSFTSFRFRIFPRSFGLLIDCGSIEVAQKLVNTLGIRYYTQISHKEVSLRGVAFSEFTYVKCEWIGKCTLKQLENQFALMDRTTTSTLQGVLNCWTESPCLITATTVTRNNEDNSNLLYFIVPTSQDRQIMQSVKVIEFAGGKINVFPQTTPALPIASGSVKQAPDIYVLW